MIDAVLAREQLKKERYFQKLKKDIDKVLPRLIRQASRQLLKGKTIDASATVTDRFGSIAYNAADHPVGLKQEQAFTTQWIISYVDNKLIRMNSPFRASFFESAYAIPGSQPGENKLVLQLRTS